MRLGDQSIIAYYSSLCWLWKEIDHYVVLSALYVADVVVFRKFVEESCGLSFLWVLFPSLS